ncbi:zinc finger protein 2-like [Gigantopelta aegis]|uniref:zinc finger protein 2-like n=1 Tax=Gigantopelta aegis TaxID=1735272 RepID=UPI001B88DBD0|nr:zinc finger protein 2-like [Gigantopelta aegis]
MEMSNKAFPYRNNQPFAMSERGYGDTGMDSYEHYVMEYARSNASVMSNPGATMIPTPQLDTDQRPQTKAKSKASDSKKTSSSQVIACDVCDKYFKSANCLSKHSVAHTNERPYRCTMCPKTFKHSSTLKNHTKKHNGQLNHVCPVCHKRFLKPSILKEHFRVHSGEKPYQCSLCSKSFAVQQYLTRHMTTHTGEKKYQCCYCPKKFTDNSSLRYHRRTHTGERPFTCNECGETFISKLTADRHYQCKHSNNRPFCCHLCGKRFKFKVYLKKHLLVHAGQRNFKCPTCSRSFFTRANLKRHVLVHSEVKPYNCCLCDKDFRCWRSMIRHLATHGKMHLWKCCNCDKRFQVSRHLRVHYEVFCPKREILSLKKQTRNRHCLTLDGRIARSKLNQLKNGSFSCKLCGEHFKSLSLLYGKHMEEHKICLKPRYSCQYCSKKYWSRGALTKHIPLHSDVGGIRHRLMVADLQKQLHVLTQCGEDESPLYCRKCHLYFRKRSSFNSHMIIHTDQIFACIHCSKKYMKYQILLEHTKRKHDEERQKAKIEMLLMENVKKNSSNRRRKGGKASHQSSAKMDKGSPPYRNKHQDRKIAIPGHLLNLPQRTCRSRKTLNYVVEKLKMSSSGKRHRT